MSVEILTVSLNPETIELLARRVVELSRSYSPVGSAPQTPQPASGPVPQQQGQDPWESATPAQQYQPERYPTQTAAQNQGQQPPAQQYQAPPQQAYQQQGQAPVCQHGPMRFVKAGVSASGKPYDAFYGCSAPRGPGQCRAVRL